MRVALIGGIGSGKSTIAKMFANLGIQTFDTDIIAKESYSDLHMTQEIRRISPESIVEGYVSIDLLKAHASREPEILEKISEVMIPHVMKKIKYDFEPYSIIEIPAIKGIEKYLDNFDCVIGMDTGKKVCIDRALKRGNLTKSEIKGRMDNQINIKELKDKIDFWIKPENTESYVNEIHLEILKAKFYSKSKMYILVVGTVQDKYVPVITAHASLACYLKFKYKMEMDMWLRYSFKKVVCSVSEEEFELAKTICSNYNVTTESALSGREVAITFCPQEYPEFFKRLQLWQPTEEYR